MDFYIKARYLNSGMTSKYAFDAPWVSYTPAEDHKGSNVFYPGGLLGNLNTMMRHAKEIDPRTTVWDCRGAIDRA